MSPEFDLKDRILRHDRPTPRYTSYPTAPNFKAVDNANTYQEWLTLVPAGDSLSLYVHIPFCNQLCYYCGCLTYATHRQDRIDAYIATLLKEAEMISAALNPATRVTHLHFGGGSPTILPSAQFATLMNGLRQIYHISENAEIAIEADPRQLTHDKIAAYAAAGVNRISFGVQDFDQKVLTAVNRPQPVYLTEQAIGWSLEHGITNINFDLMYGLPHQTVESITETIHKAASLKPARIAFFGYAHVPWMKNHMQAIDAAALPDATQRYDLFTTGQTILQEAGYVQVGIDHFVRPSNRLFTSLHEGTLHRNFQGYTTDNVEYLIGLGASAIGNMPMGYSQNHPDIAAYTAAVEASQLPVKKMCHRRAEDRIVANMIENIMCYQAIDLDYYKRHSALPAEFFDSALHKLQPLINDNLVILRDHHLAVAPSASMVTRLVASAFDAYLPAPDASRPRHAAAI